MDEAERCDHLGYIYLGRLLVNGTPSELKSLEKVTPSGFRRFRVAADGVTEAFRAEKGAAAASSYRIDGDAIVPGTASIGNGRSEICWAVITNDSRYALTTNFAEAGGFVRSAPDVDRPDLQLHFVVAKLVDHGRKTVLGHGYSCHVCLLRPQSRGEIRLASADPLQPPVIDPNYLSADYDLKILIEGIRRGLTAWLKWWEDRPGLARAWLLELPLVGGPAAEQYQRLAQPYIELFRRIAQRIRREHPGLPPMPDFVPAFLTAGLLARLTDEVRNNGAGNLTRLVEPGVYITVKLLADDGTAARLLK